MDHVSKVEIDEDVVGRPCFAVEKIDFSNASFKYNNGNHFVISNLNLRTWINKIGIVFQYFKFYAFSVAENILMHECSTKEDEHKVVCALKEVGLYEKIVNSVRPLRANLGESVGD